MRHQPYRHIRIMEGGAELHTRKGWRGISRPVGTNRRRKLTGEGIRLAPLSHAYRSWQSAKAGAKAAPRWFWTKLKGAANEWLDGVKAARLKREAEAAEKAAMEAAAKAGKP